MKQTFFFLAMLFLPYKASAAYSGSCGENVNYDFNTSTMTLTISGTGKMTDYSLSVYVPWQSYSGAIESVVVENGVTSVGKNAFDMCDKIITVALGNTVSSIGNSAFNYCSSLTDISFPDCLESIGSSAFFGCTSLTAVTIPDNVQTIGENAFFMCSNITTAIIGRGVKKIDKKVFADCAKLESVILGENVTTLDYQAFYRCKKLTSIVLPSTIISIGQSSFYGSGLTDVYCYTTEIPSTGLQVFNSTNIANGTLHVPSSVVEVYKVVSPWSGFKEVVALTDGDPKPTSIESVMSIYRTENIIYDIQGRRLRELGKGLNIINGKKIIVR